MEESEERKKKFLLEDEFRNSLFEKAYKEMGSLRQLGRKMGYGGPSPNWYVRRMWYGEQAITLHRLKVLSEITSIPMSQILLHAKEIESSERK